MIQIDASPASAVALCLADGCGWRSPAFRAKTKAQASGARHRADEHPDADADAERKRSARAGQAA